MRRLVIPFAAAAALLCDAALPAQPVTNGGFETLGPSGFPADWEPVGAQVEVSRDAHSGRRALRFVRPENAKTETGLNRAWKPRSGEQGKMLAELKGGVRFWYKAVRSDGCRMVVYVIPMTSDPIERTGSRRAEFVIPASRVGDGRWHEGALKYDFTDNPKVKWVHVSVRLQRGPGEMLFDDVRWVRKVGPRIALLKPRAYETPGGDGRSALVLADLTNVGDEPVGRVEATLALPPGLAAEPARRVVDRLPVNGERVLKWTLRGAPPAGAAIDFRARAKGLRAETRLVLQPKLEFLSFSADRFLLSPGESTIVRARVRNAGRAAYAGLVVRVMKQNGCRVGAAELRCARVLPGQTVEMTTTLRAGRDEGDAFAAARCDAAEPAERRAELVVAAAAPAQRLAGPLWVRQSKGRLVGELRARGACLAKIPYLARVRFFNARGELETVAPTSRGFEPVRDREGGLWTFRLRVHPLSPTLTRFECRVRCDRPRRVAAFEALHLYVGEGDPGAPRLEAIFNGLEWLVGDELSSDTQDIAWDHPHRIRYVPHPNMVSIPYMAVRTKRGVVGLLWNARDRWDGEHDRPQPVFASPDRFEGRASHLMGLMTPNCLTGLEANTRAAKTPYVLVPGKTLTLRGELYVDPDAADALAAQDAWAARHRPEPAPSIPQGDPAAWIAWSMGAYLETLYLPDEKKWLPYLGGPGLGRKPRMRADFCWDLLVAARWTRNPAQAKRFADMAQRHLKLYHARPRSVDMGFDYAGVSGLLAGQNSRAAALLHSRRPDGSWRFDADRRDQGVFKGRDYHELGPDDAAELGTCARRAYEVLRYVRLSGDARTYRDAVKTLEFMKRFHVPRAAQVWEVPVHTPDILAAADAMDAYLEAYRFSGDPQWLREARRWARAGIAFIYVWGDPRFSWMRFSTIPVWGASWFRCSWFGRPVQWNGLRFAAAALKLHAYDPKGYAGLSWREWAWGVTVSAIHQQAQDGAYKYLWPDNYNAVDGRRSGWNFAPSRIIHNMCALTGRPAEPQTVIVAQGETRGADDPPGRLIPGRPIRRVHVTSCARIERVAWRGDQIDLSLRYPPKKSGYSMLVGLARPEAVLLDGEPLSPRRSLSGGSAPGFYYESSSSSLIVRVTHDGPARLRVRGARCRPCALRTEIVKRIAFEFEDSLAGWVAAHDLADLDIVDGKLTARATGRDPYLIRPGCDLAPDSVRALVIRLRVTGGRGASVYWTTQDSPRFAEDKTVRFAVQPDGRFHVYRLPVGDHPMWRGRRITALRIDPTSGAPDAHISIDYIRGE